MLRIVNNFPKIDEEFYDKKGIKIEPGDIVEWHDGEGIRTERRYF